MQADMHAGVGDRIIIHGHRVGEPDRDCEVLEARGADATAPFVVRWGDSGHESLFFPGPDATVKHYENASH
jgi:hypothetical protein